MREYIDISVQSGDAEFAETDLLVMKNAVGSSGVGQQVAHTVDRQDSRDILRMLPGVEDIRVINQPAGITADAVLYIGAPYLSDFEYSEIRSYTRRSLEIAAREKARIEHITHTLHGVGYGLDEETVFSQMISGVQDAVQQGSIPFELEEIMFIEQDRNRAERMEKYLSEYTVDGRISTDPDRSDDSKLSRGNSSEMAADDPLVFIAMPFDDEFDDFFHYGMKKPVKDNGYLPERIDQEPFTGDIVDRIHEKIESASLMIADVTEGNPNVTYEVGYARASDTDVYFVTQSRDETPFDIEQQNSYEYDDSSVRDLEEHLNGVLEELDVE